MATIYIIIFILCIPVFWQAYSFWKHIGSFKDDDKNLKKKQDEQRQAWLDKIKSEATE